MKIYVASFRYGKPNLSRVTVEKETPKLFKIVRNSEEDLLGFPVGIHRVVHKENDRWFKTGLEAMSWLLEKVNENIARSARKLAETKAKQEKLSELYLALKEGDEELLR